MYTTTSSERTQRVGAFSDVTLCVLTFHELVNGRPPTTRANRSQAEHHYFIASLGDVNATEALLGLHLHSLW